MQTPAILNISSPASGTATPARPGPAAQNGAFNQMLSQQISERRDADKSAQARAAAQTDKSDAKQPEAKPSTAAPGETKASQGNGASGETASTKDKEQQPAEGAATAPTATELLAQAAAGVALLQAQPAAGADAAADSTVTAADRAALDGKRGLLASADQGLSAAAAGKDLPQEAATAPGKKADFAASLRQESEQQAAPQSAARGADAIAADKLLELSAAKKMQAPPAITASMAPLQPGAQIAAQAAGAKAMDHLTPHVGNPGWDQALGQKVVWMVAGAQQSASLTLNPPDLGPLQVVLNVSNGQADASFFSAQPEVRQALEAALPKLRDMMNQAGVELGQTSVSAGMPDRHDRPGNQPAQQRGHGAAAGNTGDEAAPPINTRAARQVIGGQGLVDTFV